MPFSWVRCILVEKHLVNRQLVDKVKNKTL
jgi:hypothetical protein